MDKDIEKRPLHFVESAMLTAVLPVVPREAVPPVFFSGVIHIFAPVREKGGDTVMVSWSELFQFCMVILTVIALVLQNNKEK